MTKPELIYTTYIKTTPEKLWAAITNPEFIRQYWGGHANISDWKKGSKWQHIANDEQNTVKVGGEVLESIPAKRLVFTWADPTNATDVSRVTFEIESIEDMVCLNVIHGDFNPGSDMINRVAAGWPRVISSLKSFLETGTGINIWAGNGISGKSSPAKGAASIKTVLTSPMQEFNTLMSPVIKHWRGYFNRQLL